MMPFLEAIPHKVTNAINEASEKDFSVR